MNKIKTIEKTLNEITNLKNNLGALSSREIYVQTKDLIFDAIQVAEEAADEIAEDSISEYESGGEDDYIDLDDTEKFNAYVINRIQDGHGNFDLPSILHMTNQINEYTVDIIAVDGYGNLQNVSGRNIYDDAHDVLVAMEEILDRYIARYAEQD